MLPACGARSRARRCSQPGPDEASSGSRPSWLGAAPRLSHPGASEGQIRCFRTYPGSARFPSGPAPGW